MRIDFGAEVVDSGGKAAGRLHEIVFDQDSRRIAGFLIETDEGVPREVFVRAGQASQIERQRLALALTGEQLAALPDARQHLYVAPDQDLEEEVSAAEAEGPVPATPDPEERPRPSTIPGLALTPNLLIPIEVERTIVEEGQVALSEGLRVLAADGAEIGRLSAVIVNDEAQLVKIVLQGAREFTVDYTLLDELDEDTNVLTLAAEDDGVAEEAETAETVDQEAEDMR